MRYRFGPYELDDARYELTKDGEPVELEPKPFALLLQLLEKHPRACSRDELFEAVWGNAAVTESSLSTAVRAIRRGLGEAAEHSVVRTVRGRGYSLGVSVERLDADASAPDPQPAPTASLRAPSASPAGAAPPSPPLFGREAELESCRRLLEAACSGRSQILLFAGEPGIGKSRLASEVGSWVRGRDGLVVWGRAHESGGQPAFWPFESAVIELLEAGGLSEVVQQALGPRVDELRLLLPRVGERLGEPKPSPRRGEVGAEELRYRGFEAVVTLLRAAAGDRPVCLVLDDLQWMDESSLELLGFVAHEAGSMPLLVVGTYRDTEGAFPALQGTLASLARAPSPALTLTLQGLPISGLREMVAHEAAAAQTDDWIESLHERTRGNPFFAAEILRLLDGSREPEDMVPPGVQSVLRRRLQGLGAPTRELLAGASVIGRTFRVRVLAEAAGKTVAEVLRLLRPAVRARLAEAVEGTSGVFAFCHPLVQETLYDDLEPDERAILHAAIADVLELQAGEKIEPQLPEIAHHLLAGQPVVEAEVALDYSLRAAAYEMRLLAFETGVQVLERALGLVDGSLELEHRRPELLLLLAAARGRAGEPDAAAATWRRAIDYARGLGDARLLARAAAGLASSHVFTAAAGAAEVAAILREALEALGSEDDDALRARLLSALSRQLTWSNERDQQLPLAQDAAELARRAGDREALIEVLAQRSMLLEMRGDDASREASYLELEEISRGGLDRETLARSRILALQHCIDRADGDRIDADLQDYEKLAAELRQPTYRVFAARVRSMRCLWRGELERAEIAVFEAFELGKKVDAEHAGLVLGAQLSALRRHQGRLHELEPGARQALERHPKLVSFRCALAAMLVDAGRDDEARPVFESLTAGGFDALQEGDPNHWLNLGLVTDVCVRLADAARAPRLEAKLASRRGRYLTVPHVLTVGCGSSYLGNLAALQGEYDEAEELLEEAIAVERRMQAAPWLARALVDLARVRLDRGGRDERESVRELLAEAGGLIDENGLAGARAHLAGVASRIA